MAEQDRHLPLQRAESAAFFVLVVQSAAGLVAWLLGWVSRSAAAEAAAWQLLVGVVVWVSCLMHQRLRRLADEESREAEALKAEHRAECRRSRASSCWRWARCRGTCCESC
jgi:hypothetical protein